MSKLLIDFIDVVDRISHKIIKDKNGYYLPKITSDQLNLESFTGNYWRNGARQQTEYGY